MNEKGLPKSLVLQQLKSKLKEDFTYDSGKILGSMCTEPHAFAKHARACAHKVSPVTTPVMNIVGVKSDVEDIRLTAQKLREKGWAVSLFPTHIRIAVMPHIKLAHVQSFLKDLKKLVKEIN